MKTDSIQITPELLALLSEIDDADKFLWRFPRQRLDAEVIRDSALYLGGLLNLKMGGPGVYAELPTGMPAPRGGWDTELDPAERNRPGSAGSKASAWPTLISSASAAPLASTSAARHRR